MPVPTPPYVTIQTGVVTGTILAGRAFSWYNDATSGSCTVTADWCTMPNNVVQAGMSQQATASSVPGNYGYGSPCLQVPSPIIIVHPVHMEKIA